MSPFLARRERFDRVGSTNDVVRGWLAEGTPEVCLAVADEQTAGRGREGRRWVAPPGAALLLSLGFRPAWLAPDQVWRLAAVVSLAMAEAAEATAGLVAGTIGLKWPNDLVVASGAPADIRKVAGVLGETDGLGTADPRVIIGLGVNVDWAAADFPPDLARTMTSLREAAEGRPVDPAALLDAFVANLEPRVDALRAGRFDGAGWSDRQVTTGRTIRFETPTGAETQQATGVDTVTGALIVEDLAAATGQRRVLIGEVTHVRLAEPIAGMV
jgi:BirA family transcriptional regulator, biotin operon repressor / biotin---[acetyl-CoA-carboxylase] ligase